jgi:Na+/melibiose symporter-like transporter
MVATVLTVGSMFLNILVNLFLIQCMDYNEWKTGKRVDGYIAALSDFASKMGGGLGAGLIGLILGVAGYVGTAGSQPDSALFAITGLFSWIPGIICLILLVLISLYDLDKFIPQVRAEIEDRRKANKDLLTEVRQEEDS